MQLKKSVSNFAKGVENIAKPVMDFITKPKNAVTAVLAASTMACNKDDIAPIPDPTPTDPVKTTKENNINLPANRVANFLKDCKEGTATEQITFLGGVETKRDTINAVCTKAIDNGPDPETNAQKIQAFLKDKFENMSQSDIESGRNGYVNGIVEAVANYNSSDNVEAVVVDPVNFPGELSLQADKDDVMGDDFGRVYQLFKKAAIQYDPNVVNGNPPANTWEDYFSASEVENGQFNDDKPIYFKSSFFKKIGEIFNGIFKDANFASGKVEDWVTANGWKP